MKNVYMISPEEKRELELISDILLSISFTYRDKISVRDSEDEDEDEDDDRCENLEDVRRCLNYDMSYVEKAQNVLSSILYGSHDVKKQTVTDYELSK